MQASTLLRHVLALDRTRVSHSHQHFLLSLCLLFCFTFIPFYPAVRHFPLHTEKKRDLCKDEGRKASSSQFLVILTPTLFFLTSSKPFFCIRSPSRGHALVLLCVYPVVFPVQGFDALKSLFLRARMFVF